MKPMEFLDTFPIKKSGLEFKRVDFVAFVKLQTRAKIFGITIVPRRETKQLLNMTEK